MIPKSNIFKHLNIIEHVKRFFKTETEKSSLFGRSGPVIKIIAVAMSVYHFYVAGFGLPEALILRPTHLMFVLVLGFLHYPIRKISIKGTIPWYDWVFAALSIIVTMYILHDFVRIRERILFVSPVLKIDYVFCIILIVLILEVTRRSMGIILSIFTLCIIAQTLLGDKLPGILSQPPVSLRKYIDYMYLTPSGTFGTIIGVSATYVFLFVLLAAFLEAAGGLELFKDTALKLSGKMKGAAGKSAVIASALFGTISGAAVANVYATGSFTIPMMKKSGFRSHIAGAIEASASCAGQIIPPVMGSSIFLMADILQRPYIDIAKAALVPGLLYVISVFTMVHLESLKFDYPKLTEDEMPVIRETLRRYGHLFLALFVLIFLLIYKYTPLFAAFWALTTTFFIGLLKADTRLWPLDRLFQALAKGAQNAVPVCSAIAAAAVVVGSLEITGLAFKVTATIVRLSGGDMLTALFLVMVTSILLGMGLPTVSAYIMAAAFGAPALIHLGVDPLAAHLFVFYFAIFSTITPPVCLAAYAAGILSESSIYRTGFNAMKLGAAGYLIPFAFTINPQILLQGDILGSGVNVLLTLLSVLSLAFALQGHWFRHLSIIERVMCIVCAVLFITPFWLLKIVSCFIFTGIGFFQKMYVSKLPESDKQ